MFLVKQIDTTVNVPNPINFCANKRVHLLRELKNRYVGRCFKGAFIVRIVRILCESDCRISTTSTSAEGSIDVQFLAEVVVFSRWDILVGITVSTKQQMIVGTYDAPALADGAKGARAVVTLLASKPVEALAVGNRIAARVVVAQHQPMQEQAAVVGTLFVCDQAAPAYRLRGALDPAARAELAPLLEAIAAALEARAALVAARKADLWFFELLLYAFRPASPGAARPDQAIPSWDAGPEWAGPGGLCPVEEGAEPVNVLELVRRVVDGETVQVSGVWARPLCLYRSSPLAARAAPDEVPPSWAPPVEGNARAVFAEFLKNILDFLTATREMTDLYSTRQLLDEHLNLWAAMRSAQKIWPPA